MRLLGMLVVGESVAVTAAIGFNDLSVASVKIAALAAGLAGLIYIVSQVGKMVRWGRHLAATGTDIVAGQVVVAQQLGVTQAQLRQLRKLVEGHDETLRNHLDEAAERDKRIAALADRMEGQP